MDKVSDVNHFSEVEVIELIRGNPYSLYFRVVQPNKDSLRYVPAASSTGLVKFKHTNDAKKINRAATNPFPEDRSIWKIDLLPTDEIQFDSMTFQLTDGTGPSAKVYSMSVQGDLLTVEVDTRKTFC